MSIVIQHKETGRRALIKGLFINPKNKKFAYVRDHGQGFKCVNAGRMTLEKTCKTLPVAIFGKRKGPFMKLAPAEGWEIVDYFEELQNASQEQKL